MSIQETAPGRYVVQIFRADPLKEANLRLCKRVSGRDAAERQERTFRSEADEWISRREIIRCARSKGMAIGSPSETTSAPSFSVYLIETYLPWAKTHLDPGTLERRAGTLSILAEDLGNTPLAEVEFLIDNLVDKWRQEGCRYSVTVDRLGRQLNRKFRPISDAGINERIKVVRAVLGHAHLRGRVLAIRPRLSMLKKKRAAPGDAAPVRYFSPEERVRFLRYARADMGDVFQVGLLTGMRPAELFHLRVDSVDLRNRKLLVQAGPCPHCPGGRWIPKTGEYRTVDIAEALLPILRRMLRGRAGAEFLIENTHGRPFSRLRGGNGLFVRTLRRAGLHRTGLSFYSMRHTFASDLITAGRPIQEVAKLLGNSPRTCELFYAHLAPGRTREAVKVLKAFEPWGTPVARTAAARDGQPNRTSITGDEIEAA